MTTVHCIEVGTQETQPDPHGAALRKQIIDMTGADPGETRVRHVYWLQGEADGALLARIAGELLCDPVVEEFSLNPPAISEAVAFTVKPGVSDPAAAHVLLGIHDLGIKAVSSVITGTRVSFTNPLTGAIRAQVTEKLLFNPTIHREVDLAENPFREPAPHAPEVAIVPLRELDDVGLTKLSKDGLLALSLEEMQRIQAHFKAQGRDPRDGELETIAQTWSEHCVHKTLKGRFILPDRTYNNLLKETIFQATVDLNKSWCVSVFEDNAGVIEFLPGLHACFKVETHNHPSAIEPYGGAGTGIGGVIRDILGTGLGAEPIANTDIFCFAEPTTDPSTLPAGVLAPKRVMHGVVAGVRDYGNRMGIPTVNGALYFHPRFAANPLVFCGTVGLLPADRVKKAAQPGDRIALIGGATGRDGIHGATFSSLSLDSSSEETAQGAVQIGNPIMEKQVLDALLKARDAGLMTAITDCGAGGLSSAIGEMGVAIGAVVELEKVPLKYQGLAPWEVWVSEAQERMVCAVPGEKWQQFADIMAGEAVPCSDIGTFGTEDAMLRVQWTIPEGTVIPVAELPMAFLHQELPKKVFHPVIVTHETAARPEPPADYAVALLGLLQMPTIASQSWVVRQYDHEVQGRTTIKPLVGPAGEGPGDAAVLRPLHDHLAGLVISNGLCPRYGALNAYEMTLNALDEAVRNAVAVGADPERIALMDNFAWGTVDTPESQGDLVLAAEACRDGSLAYGAPFISGKDSLHNEYKTATEHFSIPSTMLISALGRMEDVTKAVSSDFVNPTDIILVLGATQDRWGGSCYGEQAGLVGGEVPRVDLAGNFALYEQLHAAINASLLSACHDLSEGGLLVGLAEMAIGGGYGARLDFAPLLREQGLDILTACFAESPGRFVITCKASDRIKVEQHFAAQPCIAIGQVQVDLELKVHEPQTETLLNIQVGRLREAFLSFSAAEGLPLDSPAWLHEGDA